MQLFSAAAGLDTTKEDYWYKYNKMRLKELVDASNGYLKRDYSAEKIGGTKGRPYKPVRKIEKRLGYSEPHEEEKSKSKKNDSRVNWDLVKSAEYRSKFDHITKSAKANKTLHKKALDILKKRSGTEYETLHLIDAETGEVVATSAHTKEILNVDPNEEIHNAVKRAKPKTLIGIHNHPNSYPPSGSDFSVSESRGYLIGVVACHNGDLWTYKAKKPITSIAFDLQVAKQLGRGYTEDEAYYMAFEALEKQYGLEWRKL